MWRDVNIWLPQLEWLLGCCGKLCPMTVNPGQLLLLEPPPHLPYPTDDAGREGPARRGGPGQGGHPDISSRTRNRPSVSVGQMPLCLRKPKESPF